jgi:outer membrane immunogenic protein
MGTKKGFLIATSAGFAAAAAMPGAQAADMPIKAPRYYEQSASWAGWYIGAHAGAAWQKADVNSNAFFLDEDKHEVPFSSASISKTGFIGGGQIGYNWQHGNFVFGIEADGSGLSGRASATVGSDAATYTSRISWLSTVRGRFGLAVGDTMAYMTAGVAFGGVRNSVVLFPGSSHDKDEVSFSSSRTKTGWTVGGGVEHMLSRNWTIGLEGLFVDLGRSTVDATKDGFGTFQFNNQAIIGRLKVNYKF